MIVQRWNVIFGREITTSVHVYGSVQPYLYATQTYKEHAIVPPEACILLAWLLFLH